MSHVDRLVKLREKKKELTEQRENLDLEHDMSKLKLALTMRRAIVKSAILMPVRIFSWVAVIVLTLNWGFGIDPLVAVRVAVGLSVVVVLGASLFIVAIAFAVGMLREAS